jgi:hypothetical protein
MKRVKKLRGMQGSWLVDVTYDDGSVERLPTAHAYFWASGKEYHRGLGDVGSTGFFKDTKKFTDYIDALKAKKRVVLTKDDIDEAAHHFERTDYLGVFDVDDIKLSDNSLSFRFVQRLPQV